MPENIQSDESSSQDNPPSEATSNTLLSLLKEKNSTEFSRILKNGSFDANFFYGDPNNGTLLHIACRSEGNHEIVKILLDSGAEINLVNKTHGSAPIHEAIENADIETLDVLLSVEKCDVNLLDVCKRTPVMKARELGRKNMVSRLLGDKRFSSEMTRKKPSSDLPPKNENYELMKFLQDADTGNTPNSTWSADEDQLLSHFKENQLDDFKSHFKIAESRNIDVDRIYQEFLEMACRTKGKSEFIAELLETSPQVDNPNVADINKTLVHTAVQHSDPKTLQILLATKTCDVNALDDYGNTALHIAAKRNKSQAVSVLLQHPEIKINELDQQKNTPLHLALSLNHRQIIRQLLKRSDIDLDTSKNLHDFSCRQIISKKYPHLNVKWFRNVPVDSTRRELFSFLYEHDAKSFIERAKFHISLLLTEGDEFFTYLQLACDAGLSEVVDKLLAWDVDPNQRCLSNTQTPIMIAAEKGFYKIVRKLLDDPLISLDPVDQETVLHSLFRGMLFAEGDTKEIDKDECDYRKCLVYILDAIPSTQLDVNFGDRQGNTALHYAVKLNDELIILLLLNAGSYVCQRNHAGDTVLRSMNPAVLEKYLDSCISTNDESSTQDNYQINLNCRIFKPPDNHSQISEIEPLLVLNDAQELRNLLEHPVLTAFLHFKWLHTKIYYYSNLVIYIIFCLALSSYVFYTFWYNHDNKVKSCNYLNNTVQPCNYLNNTVNPITNQSTSVDPITTPSPPRSDDIIEYILRFTTAVLCMILALRETFQMYVDTRKYFTSLENWLEVCLIIITFSFLSQNFDEIASRQMAATAIFASGFELMLLIGRHPSLSTNTEIFKTVTFNFLKFIRYHLILILSFAFCSYILYHRKKKCQSPINEFGNVAIQSFITLTTPANDSALGDQLNLRHALYGLNVFFITIVLSCLLSGLAVNDIHVIRKKAQLLGIISRIRCIWYVDNVPTIHVHRIISLAKQFANCCWSSCCKLVCNQLCACIRACIRTCFHTNIEQRMRPDREVSLSMYLKRDEMIGQQENNSVSPYVPMSSFLARVDQESSDQPSYTRQLPRSANVEILPSHTRQFPDKFSKFTIRVLPNDNMAMLLVDQVLTEASKNLYPLLKYSSWRMDSDIVKSASKILEKRKRHNIVDYQQVFKKLGSLELPDIEIKLKDESVYAAINELRQRRNQRTKLMPGTNSESVAGDTYVKLELNRSSIDIALQAEPRLAYM